MFADVCAARPISRRSGGRLGGVTDDSIGTMSAHANEPMSQIIPSLLWLPDPARTKKLVVTLVVKLVGKLVVKLVVKNNEHKSQLRTRSVQRLPARLLKSLRAS